MADSRLCWTPYLLRYLRLKKGWSLFDTCVAWNQTYPEPHLKLSKNQVLLYELGQSVPRADRVAMLSQVFGVDPAFFFTKSKEEMAERMGEMYKDIVLTIKRRGPTMPFKNQHTMKKAAEVVDSESTRLEE